MDQTEQIAKSHANSSHFMDSEMVSMIKNQIKASDTDHKQHVGDIRSLKADLKKNYDHLEAVKKSYESACRASDDAKAAFEKADKDLNVTKGAVEKLRKESNDKAHAADKADAEYQKILAATNDTHSRHYAEVLPKAFNALQASEEQRVDFTKNIFVKYADLLLNEQPEITACLEKMMVAAKKVNKTEDSLQLVITQRTNEKTPPPIAYVNYHESSVSGSKKAVKSKGVDGESLESMAPDKASKKCAKRILELEKEILEADNKRIGIETLVDAYMAQDDMVQNSAMDEATQQLDDIENTIDTLRLKKFKYESFLAGLEKKPGPTEPQLYCNQKSRIVSDQIREGVMGKDNKKGHSLFSLNSVPSVSSMSASLAPAFGPTQMFNAPQTIKEHTPRNYKTLYVFKGDDAKEELSFELDETLEVLETKDKDWYRARNASGKEGFIPHNYVKQLDE